MILKLSRTAGNSAGSQRGYDTTNVIRTKTRGGMQEDSIRFRKTKKSDDECVMNFSLYNRVMHWLYG